MSCALTNHLPMTFSSNERNFSSLIESVESIPVSRQPQDYLAIAIVIQQDIKPLIRIKEPQIAMEGNVLSSKITQSKGFGNQLKIFPSILDPVFLPLLNSNEIHLKESIIATRTEERVKKISKVLLLICRIDKDKSALESTCEGAIEELIRMRDSIKGPFNVSVKALMSESAGFSRLTNSLEPRLLASPQDAISQSVEVREQPVFKLEPKKGVLLERHFDHRESEETVTKLSFSLEGDEIITTQKKNVVKSEFTDLRYESEASFSL